jgi:hypothetical protein
MAPRTEQTHEAVAYENEAEEFEKAGLHEVRIKK